MSFVKYSIETDAQGQQHVKVAGYKPGTYESTAPEDGTHAAALSEPEADSTAELMCDDEKPLTASSQVAIEQLLQAPKIG